MPKGVPYGKGTPSKGKKKKKKKWEEDYLVMFLQGRKH